MPPRTMSHFFFGLVTSESLGISSDTTGTPSATNDATRVEASLLQPGWINHSDLMDVDMADDEAVVEQERSHLRSVEVHFTGEEPRVLIPEQCSAKPSAGLNAFRSLLDFDPTQVPAATATQNAYIYEPPATFSAFGVFRRRYLH